MNNWSPESWREVVSAAPEGIVVCDATVADMPVVYANAAFAQLCGYPVAALLGTNLRILQAADRDQECRQRLRDAIARGEPCRVMMRNYRPDGSLFWNEMLIQPMRDAETKRVAHWVAFCRDASERLKSADRGAAGLPAWMREDRLTGLHSRAYFEELLRRDWLVAQRDSHEIGLTLFDIDDLTAYNAAFDKSAGDACIRRVARVITASYRRGSDFVGRWDGGMFAVLTQGDATEKASEYAGIVSQRVRELLIHHPRAGSGRFVSLSAGVASLVPPRGLELEAIINACQAALRRAKVRGKNSISAADASDFEKK
jgi:diguanylate cyclase (GGDEF)-like protein/PAS domain S-box-containing protein